jgi:hypothetical protein
LILQGGGAVGAYEAGVYEALYENLIDQSLRENRQLFDIIAGTSAGAMNATIIVNHVLQNKDKENPWKGSVEKLYDFWDDISTYTFYFEDFFSKIWLDSTSAMRERFDRFWKNSLSIFKEDFRTQWFLLPFYYFWPDKYGSLGSEESFRRYLSFLQFTAALPPGTPNVLSAGIFQPDFKFLNPFNNLIRYDNSPLVRTIRNGYWDDTKNPILTDEGQPRLLLVAVDVQDSATVTFDSYPKKNNRRISIYGDEDRSNNIKENDKSEEKGKLHTIRHGIQYDDGIRMKHLLTTFSSHLRHAFPRLNVKPVTVGDDFEIKDRGEEKPRPFMDGFYLSNTPLREVLQAHRDYYHKIKDSAVPQLEIYIGDLYTTKERGTPLDPDAINNRIQNVLYHDKSKYDEKVTTMVSDYLNIIDDLMGMLKNKGMTDSTIYEQLNNDLEKRILSNHRSGGPRKSEDLIKGRVTINKIHRIEYGESQRLDDSEDIYGKAFDFSKRTIRDLMKKGYEDTIKKLNY